MTNNICLGCPLGRNCMNGRWCTSLGLYVEHAAVPPCQPAENSTCDKPGAEAPARDQIISPTGDHPETNPEGCDHLEECFYGEGFYV